MAKALNTNPKYKKVTRNNLASRVFALFSLSLFIISGCQYEESIISQKDGDEDKYFAALIYAPVMALAAASVYHHEHGRWPNTVHDLQAFDEGPLLDINWVEFQDIIVFEQLPSGGLKIISTDPNFPFSITTDVPPKQKQHEVHEENQEQEINIRR